ncbi:MAG: chromate efflux transporter [Alphaproteobacteria bacterium]|nr:chromate efflux transporter [Alphaproteobacteria bacterium]
MMNPNPPSFRDFAAACFRIGCLGFGGPAGQIALMHRIFVDEKKWIEDARYMHALNYCMLLPGPEAQQLATYVGWLLHGVRGGVVAGALFVLPGTFLVIGLAWIYAAAAQAPVVAAFFYGIKAAVLALVIEALIKVSRRALKSGFDVAIAVAAFVALMTFGIPFPLVILAAALIGLLRRGASGAAPSPSSLLTRQTSRSAFLAAGLWTAAWLGPLGACLLWLGPDHILAEIGGLFAHLAVVTFGGAYAVLAYLQQQAVDVHGWLTASQMIDGLGLAETTPGPLVLVNVFVGFLAAYQASGGGAALALAGAAMAAWQTFAPSYVWIFAGAPFAERLRASRIASAALAAITAAVLGVIAQLAFVFASHVLFQHRESIRFPWGTGLELPVAASVDVWAAALALAASIALIRLKSKMLVVIAASAAVGAALNLSGLAR